MKNASLFAGVLFTESASAFFYQQQIKISWLATRFIVGTGLALLVLWIIYPFPIDRAFAWGVPSALILMGAVFSERNHAVSKRWKKWIKLGDSSYSLYLVHLPLFHLLLMGGNAFFRMSGIVIPADLFFILFACVAIVLSHQIYLVIEKKFLNMIY